MTVLVLCTVTGDSLIVGASWLGGLVGTGPGAIRAAGTAGAGATSGLVLGGGSDVRLRQAATARAY
eukprot:6720315-Pyramimonas_sp.AAC.1